MNFIIDRFEGNFVVLETEGGSHLNVPKKILPASAKEGDVVTISIDHAATKKRQQEIKQLMAELKKK